MKSLIILFFVLSIISVNCLQLSKPNDICLRTSECNIKNNYPCGWKYCTASRRECGEFLELSHQLRSIRRPLNYNHIKFHALINSLKEC